MERRERRRVEGPERKRRSIQAPVGGLLSSNGLLGVSHGLTEYEDHYPTDSNDSMQSQPTKAHSHHPPKTILLLYPNLFHPFHQTPPSFFLHYPFPYQVPLRAQREEHRLGDQLPSVEDATEAPRRAPQRGERPKGSEASVGRAGPAQGFPDRQ